MTSFIVGLLITAVALVIVAATPVAPCSKAAWQISSRKWTDDESFRTGFVSGTMSCVFSSKQMREDFIAIGEFSTVGKDKWIP
jgi:hypothetical protein